ncbi:hypothetical protein JCGZ_00547 [Jatropha curcas]|uniref:Uncharacterized protein n=1 Tax=Jatropha curcas TaxID=180498 RepID=A0A067JGY3_JATCU|nr:hypothetical protein JCGZ_00547 [Jatropha curcas]
MGGEGAGLSRHTDSSISTAEITEKLAKKLNRQPTPMEVFTFTHTKNHDGFTFIDRRAKLFRAQTGKHPTIDQLQLYLKAARGVKKRKWYRIGSQLDILYPHAWGFSE